MKVFAFGEEAQGIIAIGQLATGVIAIGQLATGVIAIGQVARGFIAIGQLSLGVFAIGQLGVGAVYGAGMLGFGTFGGGAVPVPLIGIVRLRDLSRGRFRLTGDRVPIRPWRIVLCLVVFLLVVTLALIPLYGGLYGVGGVLFERQ